MEQISSAKHQAGRLCEPPPRHPVVPPWTSENSSWKASASNRALILSQHPPFRSKPELRFYFKNTIRWLLLPSKTTRDFSNRQLSSTCSAPAVKDCHRLHLGVAHLLMGDLKNSSMFMHKWLATWCNKCHSMITAHLGHSLAWVMSEIFWFKTQG